MKISDAIEAYFWESTSINNCNTFLLRGDVPVLLDPGHSRFFTRVEHGLCKAGWRMDDVGLVVATHGHADHCEAAALFNKTGVLFAMHEEEWRSLNPVRNGLHGLYGKGPELKSPDLFLQEGTLRACGVDLEVLHTPGHSPGSLCLYWPQQRALFCGDCMFRDGIGRTDLPGGNPRLLRKSIERLSCLDLDWLLPGHGEAVGGSQAIRSVFRETERFWVSVI